MNYSRRNTIDWSYRKDSRLPIDNIYHQFEKLAKFRTWISDKIYTIEVEQIKFNQKIILPSYGFKTKKKGPAIYLIAGIHGEEPAGPNALARSLGDLQEFNHDGFPLVVVPLANPKGYALNWRYPNEVKNPAKGHSVGDSEHLLLDSKGEKPRSKSPISWYANKFTGYIKSLLEDYPPKLVIDFHEDDNIGKPYIYSHGQKKTEDPVARSIVKLLINNGVNLQLTGTTARGEKIDNGIVYVEDGSIDEFLAAGSYWEKGRIKNKPVASSVIVVETPARRMDLKQRIKIHRMIIRKIPQFWKMLS